MFDYCILAVSNKTSLHFSTLINDMKENMNMNLFNHNNNSTDNYDIVQLISCGC